MRYILFILSYLKNLYIYCKSVAIYKLAQDTFREIGYIKKKIVKVTYGIGQDIIFKPMIYLKIKKCFTSFDPNKLYNFS